MGVDVNMAKTTKKTKTTRKTRKIKRASRKTMLAKTSKKKVPRRDRSKFSKAMALFSSKTRSATSSDSINPQTLKGSSKKFSAMERINLLLDDNSFIETGLFAKSHNSECSTLNRDGVITGHGTIDGRPVCVYAQDFKQKAGTLGAMHARKIRELMELATKTGCPIIGIEDSGGARIQEGVASLDGYAQIFYRNVHASGIIPQISIVAGPCAGGAVYSPALTDFIFMIKGESKMFITGPKVIESATSEKIDMEHLGGAKVHAEYSGVAHFEYDSEEAALLNVRNLLTYLPSNNVDGAPFSESKDSSSRKLKKLISLVPADPSKSYDMRAVIAEVFDKNTFFGVHDEYAKNIITGFARLAGVVVGVVANQPAFLAGCLDINSSDKAARFVRFCDAFNIPLINLVDVPGYLPGKEQEYHGIIRHGAELLYAYAEATVPKISVILRKAYGGAYIVMCSKEMHFDQVLAWPIARVAVMGAKQAADILFKDVTNKTAKIKEYEDKYLNPYVAAEVGAIDRIIDPAMTRVEIIRALNVLESKKELLPKRKHGNIPL